MKTNNLTADKLRKSILQLAIQGKLVKQNPDDEPASELVKKIYAEKQKLIAEGKIKKDKTESYIYKGDDNRYYEKIGKNEPVDITDDLPFDIPDSWEWIRFGNLFNVQTGASFKKDIAIAENKENYVRVLRGGNVFPFELKFKPDDLFIPNELVKIDILLLKNDLVTPAVTSLENIGKIGVVKEDFYNVTAGGFVYIFRPFLNNSILSNLNMYFISSPIFVQLMQSITKKSGQAFYNMNKERLLNLMIPVPSLAEQQRIVEKIESMEPYLAQYDKIEKQLTKLEGEIKDKLKKSILQYAIQGKLVKQDPNDEPASVLLERIKAEKEKLIKEGKIKRDKNESFIYQGDDKNYYENINGKVVNITDEIPFDIPDNWCWCRLGCLFQHNTGKALNAANTKGLKLSYITTSNLYWNRFELDNLKEMFFTNEEIDKCSVIKGDLLVCEGGDIGRSAIWKYDYSMRIQNHIHKLRPYYKLSIDFYYNVLFLYKNSGLIGGKGIGIQGLSSNALHNIFIPLPSYNEQLNIVNTTNRLIDYLNN